MTVATQSAAQTWRAVAAALPQFDWRTATFHRGAFHEVAIIGDGAAIRLCSGTAHQARARREMHNLELLESAALTFPVPGILSTLASTPEWSAYATTTVPGESRQSAHWAKVRTSVSQVLKELATVPHDRYRPVRQWCGGDEWPDQVAHLLAAADREVRHAAATAITKLLEVEAEAPRSFVHGDFSLYNILFDGESVSGLIDFDTAGIGDPAADLAPLLGVYGSASLLEIADENTVARARSHRATLSLQVAAAAELIGDVKLRDHAVGNFSRRLKAGALEEPNLSD